MNGELFFFFIVNYICLGMWRNTLGKSQKSIRDEEFTEYLVDKSKL